MLSFAVQSVDFAGPLEAQGTLCTAFSVRSIREHRDALLNGVPDPSLLNQIAATIIQSWWRRYAACRKVERIREEKRQQQQTMLRTAQDDDRIVVTQCAVRRYLANKTAKEKAVEKKLQVEDENAHYHIHLGSKIQSPATANVPSIPADERILSSAAGFEPGDFAKECAAIAIQAQVRRRLAQKQIKGRARIKSMFLGQFARRVTTTNSRELAPQQQHGSTAPLRGNGLEAVFWTASCYLLDPRRPPTAMRNSTALRPGSSTPRRGAEPEPYRLLGLQMLHDAAMSARKMDAARLPDLPITMWVSGPLLCQAERRRLANSLFSQSPQARVLTAPTGNPRTIILARTVASHNTHQSSIGLLRTPRKPLH